MESIISVRNLSKSYGEKLVLNQINLEIAPGQVIGYIGPNGAGKSTTVKILIGLISDFTGEVYINGMDIRKNALDVKKSIGYVPELAELYDVLTPYEFLHFIGSLYDLTETQIDERMNRMLEAFGMLGNIDQRMESFSKGMKQKVLIVSAMLHNPEIVILDEPLSGLDANAVIVVKDLIRKLADSGKTVFYCSHMMDIVEKVSDRIILIDKGEVLADGTIEALRAKEGKDSLEAIFSGLTSDASMLDAGSRFLESFDE